MDHYKVLGISKTASKDQIKQAFRKLALQFHPDKHSLSLKPVRDDATRRFKQASEAYDILIDDRKRANYNSSSYNNQNYGYGGRSNSTNASGFSSYGYGGSRSRENYGSQYSYRRGPNVSRFEVVFRYMGTRSFLINLAFAGVLLGGSYFIDSSGKALWKMRNSGKSFEEVMETIEKTKTVKDEKT